jgi:hypothetical protein
MSGRFGHERNLPLLCPAGWLRPRGMPNARRSAA